MRPFESHAPRHGHDPVGVRQRQDQDEPGRAAERIAEAAVA